MFQFAGVNVNDATLTVPSVVSLEEMGIVTFAVGAWSSTTEKVAVPPASVVTRPEVGVTTTFPTFTTLTFAANSDVLFALLVAVAETLSPMLVDADSVVVKLTLPLPLVG